MTLLLVAIGTEAQSVTSFLPEFHFQKLTINWQILILLDLIRGIHPTKTEVVDELCSQRRA